MHNRDFFSAAFFWKWGRFQDAKSLPLLHNQESTFSAHLQLLSQARKNFGYSRKLLVKVTPTTAFYQSEVLDPSFSLFFGCLTKIPYFEIDGFVLQLQSTTYSHSFPKWLFFVVYQVGGVTTIIFCYVGQSFKKSKMMSWCFDLSINSLVNFMMTYKELPGWRRPVEALRGNDRGLGCWLRTWWIRHSQSVRPRRRCETASHKCCRPKGNRRTKVELLLPRTKKVRVLLVSKNNTLGNFAGRKIEEEEEKP